ncbi:MAG: alpha-galactosidase, partial [Planctomycetota bacterium]
MSAGSEALLRAVSPEAILQVDGKVLEVGGASGQPNGAFVGEAWLAGLRSGDVPAPTAAFELTSVRTEPIGKGSTWAGIEWEPGRGRHSAPDAAWPPRGMTAAFEFLPTGDEIPDLRVTVRYALFDGLPGYAKWVTVRNEGREAVTLERITTEMLRAVEHSSWVESRGLAQPTPALHVETDYAFGGMTAQNANGHVVHWREDPTYLSQVSYERTTPCLLEVSPDRGPAVKIEPGGEFDSYRTYLLATGQRSGRERSGLARRRLIRTVAPWVTENPLMMHVRWSDEATVTRAIEQCAEVGFEMVILTFGSGFDAENRDPEYVASMARLSALAEEAGIELGGYSLLSSRRIEPAADNCIHPETGEPGADIHGSCPSLTSGFGQRYFATLRSFYESTGFRLLEHDGSYPGTPDAAVRLPLQSGLENSVWAQWKVIDGFYRWCRSRDIYLNVPDHYYLGGSSKCGMGYREVNWSLPRAEQVIHTRQNIFDGTWEKTPSMGWMFVPLSEYHGGGEAATIEPLAEHLSHYKAMLYSNLALGVQACYRGPRLYDTDETKEVVADAVGWFKANRRILEADVVHGRRADGRDVDWMMHVDPWAPEGEAKAMVVAFNPLGEAA